MAVRLVKGNTAVVVGALYAGCAYFLGYPITPASEIAEDAARFFPLLGRGFLQAESETAAINMIYGVSAAGRRAMTASSGPGISLMVEGLSYLAGAELPCVVVDIMRAGPGLGNIGPEQADYNQMVKGGGHGSYRNIVLAPGSVQEMCDLTIQGFALADKYRTPAIVLSDGVLGQMVEPLNFPTTAVGTTVDETWAVAATRATRNNVVTSIHLDFDEMERANEKLQAKYAEMERNDAMVEAIDVEDADVVLVAYGICSRLVRAVAQGFRQRGARVGLLRPITLCPFPSRAFRDLAASRARNVVVVEMSPGQFADDVRLATDCSCPVHLVSRLGGNVPSLEQIEERVRELL